MIKTINNKDLRAIIAPMVFIFSYFVFSPFITPLLISKGFSKEIISISFSVPPFLLIIFSSISGKIADHVGRKKVLNYSILMMILSILLYLMIEKSILLLIITSTLSMVSYQVYNLVSLARAEDSFDEKSRGKDTGLFETLISIGALLGGVFGSLMVIYFPISSTLKLSLILFLLIYLFGQFIKTINIKKLQKSDFNFIKNLKLFWKNDDLKGMAILGFATNFSNSCAVVFVPLLITQDLNSNISYVGLFSATLSFAHLTQYFFGKSCDKYGNTKIIIRSVLCFSIAMLIFLLASSPIIVLIAGLGIGLSAAAWNTSAYSYLSKIGENTNEEGAIIGTYGSFAFLGAAFGYLVSGLIAYLAGTRFVFLIYAVIAFIAVLFASKYLNPKVNKQKSLV